MMRANFSGKQGKVGARKKEERETPIRMEHGRVWIAKTARECRRKSRSIAQYYQVNTVERSSTDH